MPITMDTLSIVADSPAAVILAAATDRENPATNRKALLT
jgi:hypothetical protein